MAILRKMDTFWFYSTCDIRRQLIVFNAVLRSKLLYGLESLQLNQASVRALESFQMKGLRKIIGALTTYGQMQLGLERTNDNQTLPKYASHYYTLDHPESAPINIISDNYKHRKCSLLVKILLLDPSGPRRSTSFVGGGCRLHDYGKKRVGRPTKNWVRETRNAIWHDYARKFPGFAISFGVLNDYDNLHLRKILAAARWYKQNFGLFRPQAPVMPRVTRLS